MVTGILEIVLVPGNPNCSRSWLPQLFSFLATPIVLVPGNPNCSHSWLPQLSLFLATPIVLLPGYSNLQLLTHTTQCDANPPTNLPPVAVWQTELAAPHTHNPMWCKSTNQFTTSVSLAEPTCSSSHTQPNGMQIHQPIYH